MKRILTIQDISCVGQCSLTVALPIISAWGIETCILPSAILSTHTYKFENYTFRDLTCDLPLIAKHWQDEKIDFDAIYTGYIGSTKQIAYIKDIINNFKKDGSLVIVDPAMADHGKLYPGFDQEFVMEMKSLCMMADYIVPNITEACFLLNHPYLENYNEADIKTLLKELASLGCKNVLLTGVSFEENKLGCAMYNSETDEYMFYFNTLISKMFHGTGDIYASCFVGGIVNGKSFYEAGRIAADFVVESIKQTLDDADEHWYGVHFEKALPYLITEFNKN